MRTPSLEIKTGYAVPRSISWNDRLIGLLAFVLLAMPRIRLSIGGIPLYLIDVFIGVLFVSALHRPGIQWRSLYPIPQLVCAYLIFVFMGELRGVIEYMKPAESIYMLIRSSLAISLVYSLPKMITTFDDLKPLLKGAVLGLIFSSVIVIMYSLAPLRPLVMKGFFSWEFLSPGADSMAVITAIGGADSSMRGRSLIGAATITAGFLGSMWPLAFLSSRWSTPDRRWRMFASMSAIITPFAILMTYGITAWTMVACIGTMIAIFGFAGGRRYLLIVAIGCMMIVYIYGLMPGWSSVDLVTRRIEMTLNNPLVERSGQERFLSYVEPFEHLMENPSWLVTGAGRTGYLLTRRGEIEAQVYDNEGLATHSAFSMAYYCYGVPGAICHILLMLSGFHLILKRLRSPVRLKDDQRLIWQSLLMAWTGLLFLWLSDHALVGEIRGVILFFFMYGLLLVCNRFWIFQNSVNALSKLTK